MKKRILLMMTGGTIVSGDMGRGLEPGGNGAVLELARQSGMEILPEDLMSLDSSNLNPAHWAQMARCADAYRERVDGIVITHGTDTMAYTAAVLHYMLKGIALPVVLTGAQLPLEAADSDAPDNLRLALDAAGDSRLHGVLVAFAGRLMQGRCARKIHSEAAEGFESVNAPDVTGASSLPPLDGDYRLRADLNPRVFLCKLTPNLEPEAVRQMVETQRYRGLVLEGYGKGGVPDCWAPVLKELIERGVAVSFVSQCTYGGADCRAYAVGRKLLELGVRDCGPMTPECALAEMMVSLGTDKVR
ncbi:MAG: asparaginase [Clostridiales bacterium]|nr:asparaginase [Clostridiales bacterium]